MFQTTRLILIVPNLNFDVYLGLNFISSENFNCLSPEKFYIGPNGRDARKMLGVVLEERHDVLLGDITYLTRYTYSNSLEELQNKPIDGDSGSSVRSSTEWGTTSGGDGGELSKPKKVRCAPECIKAAK